MKLLELAKTLDVKTKLPRYNDNETLEVAVAYIKGEISLPAIAKAMKVSTSLANGRVMAAIFSYVRANPQLLDIKFTQD